MEGENKNLGTLLEAIESDIVTFSFTKSIGSSRIARGTRNLDLIPLEAHPKGTSKRSIPENILVFFDFTKNQWRSCKKENIFGTWEIKNSDLLNRIRLYEEKEKREGN